MKILDVHGFQTGTDAILHKLKSLYEQTEHIKQAVEKIISLEEELKGEGGEAIRSFYADFHRAFLLFLQGFLKDYDRIIVEMKRSLQAFEAADRSFIHEMFLDLNIEHGLKTIQNITSTLTSEANQAIDSVHDIVSLPRLQDYATLNEIEQARQRTRKTMEDLHEFDQHATQSLNIIEHDIDIMTTSVKEIGEMFQSGRLNVGHFKLKKLMSSDGYRSLAGKLVRNSGLEPTEIINIPPYGDYLYIKYLKYENGLIVKETLKRGTGEVPKFDIVEDVEDPPKDGVIVGPDAIFVKKVAKGVYDGAGEAVGDVINGFKSIGDFLENFETNNLVNNSMNFAAELIKDPKTTWENIKNQIAVKFIKYDIIMPRILLESIKQAYIRDVEKGDAESRARFFTYAFVTIGLGFIGDKGITKVGTAASKVSTVVETANKVGNVVSKTSKTVTAGSHLPIPYNVLDNPLDLLQKATREKFGDHKVKTVTSDKNNVVKNKNVKKISEADRKKLEKWTYPPDDEKYLKYKKVYDNPKYYNQKTGEINWPPNNGFDGKPVKVKLEKGKIIDRYGSPGGSFVSPTGISYEQRALALHSDNAPYYKYEILKPFDVEAGKIAPWFDRPGGGTQYFTGNIKILDIETGDFVKATVENLERLGYIRKIK